MGKQIRRTITITLTETWTFVWAKTDDTPEQTMTVKQETPEGKQKEEQDAALPLPVSTTAPATPSGPDPPASPVTPDTAPALHPEAATQVAPSLNRKRERGHRAKRNRPQ